MSTEPAAEAPTPSTAAFSEAEPVASPSDAPRRPLARDRSFWGLLATQFLGAFNDNFYKQFVLLLCIDYVAQARLESDPYQSTATAVFALPFVLFSLYTGAVADRYSKRTIVVLCKALEIVVMLAATAVLATFAAGTPALLWAAIAVVGLMSLQSTLFGPSKYGILPELFDEADLSRVNGAVQMTTFIAILLGTVAAGYFLGFFRDRLWLFGLSAVTVSVAGTLTSLLVRRTPVANPGQPFTWKSFTGDPTVWKLAWTDARLRTATLVYSLFFMLGAVLQLSINAFGRNQMGYSPERTSLLVMTLTLGMGIGCSVAGQLSRRRNRTELVSYGGIGLLASGLLAGVAPHALPRELVFGVEAMLLCLLGVSAGLTAVPLQVTLQSVPPKAVKGRMIGVVNFCTWVGILLGGILYFGLSSMLRDGAGVSRIGDSFALVGLLMLPAVVLYWPKRGDAAAAADA